MLEDNQLRCSVITLHGVDEVSVFAPYFSPEALVVLVVFVLHPSRAGVDTRVLRIIKLSSPPTRKAVLLGTLLVSARFGPPHLLSVIIRGAAGSYKTQKRSCLGKRQDFTAVDWHENKPVDYTQLSSTLICTG